MSLSQAIMVVRHPQTVMNAGGRYIGRSDSPLTETGREQLRWLREVAAFWQPELTLSSPLGRAVDTARAISGTVEVRVLEDLQEIDFGQAEGHTYDELAEMGMEPDYASGGSIAPGGERGDAFVERVERAASAVEESECRVLVMTHGGVMRRLLVRWLNLPGEAAWSFDIPNAAVAMLRVCHGAGVLEQLVSPSLEVRRSPLRCGPWNR